MSSSHSEQKASEAQARYDTLTRRIQALDTDIDRAQDLVNRQTLRERRDELSQERELLVQEMGGDLVTGHTDSKDDIMEREDLRMLYEVRSEVALLRREVEELRVLINQVRESCAPMPGSLPPALLNVMIIGGLVVMVALIVVTLRMSA